MSEKGLGIKVNHHRFGVGVESTSSFDDPSITIAENQNHLIS